MRILFNHFAMHKCIYTYANRYTLHINTQVYTQHTNTFSKFDYYRENFNKPHICVCRNIFWLNSTTRARTHYFRTFWILISCILYGNIQRTKFWHAGMSRISMKITMSCAIECVSRISDPDVAANNSIYIYLYHILVYMIRYIVRSHNYIFKYNTNQLFSFVAVLLCVSRICSSVRL